MSICIHCYKPIELEKVAVLPDARYCIACARLLDSAKSKAVVMELVNDMGFDAVDAGGLDESWRQQPATPVYTADLDMPGVREALRKATRERKPEWRATPKSPGSFEAPA